MRKEDVLKLPSMPAAGPSYPAGPYRFIDREYISYAKPLLEGSLPDGSRIQASLAKDVSTKGPTFSIRKFRSNPFSLRIDSAWNCTPR